MISRLARGSAPAAALAALLSLTACSGGGGATAAPTVTVTVTAYPSAGAADDAVTPTPTAPSPSPGGEWGPPLSGQEPPIFGTTFQTDPGHDFSKGVSPSRDGIVRGRLRTMLDADVAEYVPVRWVENPTGRGRFEEPPEGDATVFAAPIHPGVVFLSAYGCTGGDQTINDRYVGTEPCSRDQLISRIENSELYALITVSGARIVKVVEIYTP